MKPEIHPQFHNATVTCACGNSFTVGATTPELKVDVCSACHPFFSGQQQRLVDRMGRIERFNRKYGRSSQQ